MLASIKNSVSSRSQSKRELRALTNNPWDARYLAELKFDDPLVERSILKNEFDRKVYLSRLMQPTQILFSPTCHVDYAPISNRFGAKKPRVRISRKITPVKREYKNTIRFVDIPLGLLDKYCLVHPVYGSLPIHNTEPRVNPVSREQEVYLVTYKGDLDSKLFVPLKSASGMKFRRNIKVKTFGRGSHNVSVFFPYKVRWILRDKIRQMGTLAPSLWLEYGKCGDKGKSFSSLLNRVRRLSKAVKRTERELSHRVTEQVLDSGYERAWN